MNIFDQNEVVVTKIVNSEKLCQPLGYDTHTGEYRGMILNLRKGFYTLALVLDGECEYYFPNNKKIYAKKDDIVFLDNFSPIHQQTKSDYYTYTINFVADSGFLTQPNIFHPSNTEKYTSLFKEAAVYFEQRNPDYMLMTKSILYKILAAIKRDNAKSGQPISKIDKIVFVTDYINQNLSNYQLSVENIAHELKVSNTYLRRIFMEITGMSPLKYIKTTRINHATDLLCTGDMSVAKVAAECGFQDVSYFCKEFRKIIGSSPLAFKKNHHMTTAPTGKKF